MGRKGKDTFELQTVGSTPSFILQMKQNLQKQNMESQKTNFQNFLTKAGYEGEEKAEALKKFMQTYDEEDKTQNLRHDIEDKNEHTKLMKQGFIIKENQKSELEEQERLEELSKFVPELHSTFAEIGAKKESDLTRNLKKSSGLLFIKKDKTADQIEGEQSQQSLGKRIESIQSFIKLQDKVDKKIKTHSDQALKKKKFNKAMLSFNDDE